MMTRSDIEREIETHKQALRYFEDLIIDLQRQGLNRDDPVFREITFLMWVRLQKWENLEYDYRRFFYSINSNLEWN